MSSYAQLKEMALRKAERSSLSQPRARAQGARGRRQTRRTRSARARTEGARAQDPSPAHGSPEGRRDSRTTAQGASFEARNETIATDDPIAKPKLAGGAGATLSRPDADKLKKPGSTWRENLSGQLKPTRTATPSRAGSARWMRTTLSEIASTSRVASLPLRLLLRPALVRGSRCR